MIRRGPGKGVRDLKREISLSGLPGCMGAVTLLAVLKWVTAKGPYHLSGLLGRVREGGSLGGDISLVEHV